MSRMLVFWYKLLKGKQSKISVLLYKLLVRKGVSDDIDFDWIRAVKNHLYDLGLDEYWTNQDSLNFSVNQFKSIINARIRERANSWWNEELTTNVKCHFYRFFKAESCMEYYTYALNYKDTIALARFRCRSNNLPVTTTIRSKGTELPKCAWCTDSVCDEFHLLFECVKFQEDRKELIPAYYWKKPNILKVRALFNCKKISTLKKLAEFIRRVTTAFEGNRAGGAP